MHKYVVCHRYVDFLFAENVPKSPLALFSLISNPTKNVIVTLVCTVLLQQCLMKRGCHVIKLDDSSIHLLHKQDAKCMYD